MVAAPHDQPTDLDAALAALRPELHRYLARMMGSVFDGEDVVQDTFLAATRALTSGNEVRNLRAWLFRIAHNTALNALRARKSERAMKQDLVHAADRAPDLPSAGGTSDALVPFMALTPKQRSAVILRDVLGHDTGEVADLTGMTPDAAKSALKRGRRALREAPAAAPVPLVGAAKARLARYANHFNAHDFDRIRAMLAAEVRLELVSVETRQGAAAVGKYFANYDALDDLLMTPGQVEDKSAILVFDRHSPGDGPAYFVRLDFEGEELMRIQDFRYARYALADAVWHRLA